MKKIIIIITCFIGLSGAFAQQRGMFHNPVIEADVPDPSMIRVGNYYYLFLPNVVRPQYSVQRDSPQSGYRWHPPQPKPTVT